ncbi:hypothetical protein [Bradyrhizobium iriomotense]|uniref:hypothetical protein n=1 Tax=Bradyrhizobium iriomotense TaxID=441950 RepID=UPI0024E0C1CD|nr:hypothetical protein [Bradyrhizobium iriomotense]
MVDGLKAAAKMMEKVFDHGRAPTGSGSTDRQAGILKRMEDLACGALSATAVPADQVRCHDLGDYGASSFALGEAVINIVAASFAGDHRAAAPGVV